MQKVNADFFKAKKQKSQKITCLTAYDAPIAHLIESCGIDIILVGDSVGNVVLGFEDTKSVSIDDIKHHFMAVRRAAQNSFIVCDLPLKSLISQEKAFSDAVELIKYGADAIKIEGTANCDLIEKLVKNNISVMGHIGYMPQSDPKPAIKGKTVTEQNDLLNQAILLEKIGAFSIVLELVEQNLAKKISNSIFIPTIGIGSGPHCDGQVLVINDLIGLTIGKVPKFVKQYCNVKEDILRAIKKFKTDVENGNF